MRIITGKVKGHRINAPKGLNTRPTSDRVKESIFNIIGYIRNDSCILDLYSGSGNIGIEFLSRGAKYCYFVDNDILSIKAIKENLTSTKLIDQAHVFKNEVMAAINMLEKRKLSFDYIFMDPPYNKELVNSTLFELSKVKLLKENGIIIAEHESSVAFPEILHGFKIVDSRRYGSTSASFFKVEEEVK